MNQRVKVMTPGEAETPGKRRATASSQDGVGSSLERNHGPKHQVNPIRWVQSASLLAKDEACRESDGANPAQVLPRLELVGWAHGWDGNVGKEAWDNRRDRPARSKLVGVRAAIVARKPGNAGGAKGRRKKNPSRP